MKNFKLPMNLQYFAENGGSDGGEQGSSEQTNPENHTENSKSEENAENDPEKGKKSGKNDNSDEKKDKKSGKSYSADDLKKAIEDAKAKWQQEKDDAKKLANMSEKQKSDYQLKKAQEKASSIEKELARYKMQDTAREMAKDAGIELKQDDIKHIVTESADSTKANLDWLTKYTNRIKKAMKSDLLKGNSPKNSGKSVTGGKKLSLGARLAKKNNTQTKSPYFK